MIHPTEKPNFNETSTEYSNFLTMMSCNRNEKSQVFTLRPTSSALTNNSLRSFDLLLPDGRCLEPSERMTSKEKKRSVFGSKSCSSSWTWNSLGELVWEGGLPWQQDPVSCGQHMAASCAEHLLCVTNHKNMFQVR